MEFRTDRIGLLLDQLESSVEYARERMAGLTDGEYFWEPAEGAWSVRRRTDTSADNVFGKGEWVSDFALQEPVPPPVTTIAWRMAHLIMGFTLRWEWTFGGRERLFDDLDIPHTADDAQDQLWEIVGRWSADIAKLTEAQLDTVGLSQFPAGLDPSVPFISIVWWQNREFIHHTAEIALLRDLTRAESRTGAFRPSTMPT
ncbi:hypothetical protein Aph01nite_45400 [Acrocarpospora phusangensis]|uniref:DinB-like domain-containing protein n=1 Tax=Acrocarpospora phusangensis TaxID=1070424 RepID=A0A919QGV1_9ACTN|nr:DinB family protein [Acrocarpospora phusangensis]GIH26230.1 hypothetical protein Aph01nite_45400 [Acrocarpospora phusangensis]